MTHAFRTFVNVYTRTIISSDYEDLNQTSILLFPGFHLMRIINQYSLRSWLFEPKLYSVQVRAEIQFQKSKLIYELEAALDRVDAGFPPTHLSQASSSQIERAIDKVTIHQQSIRQMIDGSDPFPWGWMGNSEGTTELEKYHELGESVRGRLLTVKEIMDEYEQYYKTLVGDLHGFRQSFKKRPLSGFSARSSLAVPAPLLARVHNIALLSRGQSSSIHEDRDSRDITHIASHPHVLSYDLGSTYNTRLSSLRSEVAQLC